MKRWQALGIATLAGIGAAEVLLGVAEFMFGTASAAVHFVAGLAITLGVGVTIDMRLWAVLNGR